jgi:hypothetical protein
MQPAEAEKASSELSEMVLEAMSFSLPLAGGLLYLFSTHSQRNTANLLFHSQL